MLNQYVIEAACPYCGEKSNNVHSHYMRKLQDLPIQGKKVKLIINNKKYFCVNKECKYKTFAEPFSFFEPKAIKTKRLQEEIIRVSLTQSSLSAEKYLKGSVADIGKSTICDLLKNPIKIVDKTKVIAVCIDDFALKKRQRYGTVMVDLQTHKLIDMIETREMAEVKLWLEQYPNIQIVSRDGSRTYASAITEAHPKAIGFIF